MSGDIIPVNHDLWMRDSDTKTCLCCEAIFTTFRRRHHCRYCGLIFCNKCATKRKEVIQGRVLERICIKCYNFLVKKRNQAFNTVASPLESGSSTPNSTIEKQSGQGFNIETMSSIEEEVVKGRVFTLTNDVPHEVELLRSQLVEPDEWEGIVSDFLQSRTRVLLQKNLIRPEWEPIVIDLVNNAVKNVCPSVQFRGDAMDINQYLRVQSIIHTDLSLSGFISGIAFLKNLAHRRMNKTINNPKILLIKEISEGNAIEKSLVSMDKLIDNEGSLSVITLKKILSINPSLIVCNKGLPQAFVADLSKNSITALINVKKKIMDLIARSTHGKILNSTDEIHHERNFMGECNVFYQENRGQALLVHFCGLHDLSVTGTIFISGPDAFELAAIKKILKGLVKEIRNVRLEKTIFSLFLTQNIPNLFNELLDNLIVFRHLVVSENQMCLKPETCAVEFYNEKDMTLGEFLITACEKTEQRCKECGNSWGAHILYYVKKEARIKISFSKANSEFKGQDIFYARECKICGKIDQNPHLMERAPWEYSFYKFLNNFFKPNSIGSVTKKCKHDFFYSSRLIFYVRGIKVIMQWESNPCYRVISINDKPDQTKYFIELLSKTLKELKKNGASIIDTLLITYRTISNLIIKDLSEENKKVQDQIIDNFSAELEKNYNRLTACLNRIQDLDISNYSNFLQVEAERRSIFLEICEIRMAMNNSIPLVKRNRKKDKLDAVSSSGDSSGDTKKSPSPNPSFVNEDEKEYFIRARSSQFQKNSEKMIRNEDLFLKPEFISLQKGNLTLPLGRNNLCIPVDENDLLSIIAYSLNSNEYFEEVLSSMPHCDDLDKIESELLSANERHFQHQFTTFEEEEFREFIHKEDIANMYGQHITFNVHMFFPRQFQIIRDRMVKDHIEFIMGIICSEAKKEQLGKSKATFSKSYNNMYILKVLDEKEFGMFKDLAPNYFRHYCNSEFHTMPCKMVRTIGCYRVYSKNHTLGKSKNEWAILFENLGCSMPKDVEIYDLKGSFNHRRFINSKEKKTKMDRNFLEDFNGLPITISKEEKKVLDMSIFNDTLFLSKQNIVDYSLLLIVSTSCKVITMGIIDYIAKYTFEKALEHRYKKVVSTDNPTITRPTLYKNRFRESIANTFFLELDE